MVGGGVGGAGKTRQRWCVCREEKQGTSLPNSANGAVKVASILFRDTFFKYLPGKLVIQPAIPGVVCFSRASSFATM